MRLGAFAVALLHDVNTQGPMSEFMRDILVRKRVSVESGDEGYGASSFLTLVQRAVQARAYGVIDGYPEDFTEPAAYTRLFGTILDDAEMHGFLFFDVMARRLQSNVIERHKVPKAILSVAQQLGRFSLRTVADVGCSLNTFLTYLAADKQLSPPELYDPSEARLHGLVTPEVSWPGSHHAPSAELRRAFFRTANRNVGLRYGLGVDLEDPQNSWQWAKSCSFNPSELLIPELVTAFDDLTSANHERVHFLRADFADLDVSELKKRYPPMDAIDIQMMLHEWGSEKQRLILDKARDWAREMVIF